MPQPNFPSRRVAVYVRRSSAHAENALAQVIHVLRTVRFDECRTITVVIHQDRN